MCRIRERKGELQSYRFEYDSLNRPTRVTQGPK